MSFLSADQIDKKIGAKKLFKFMRHGCNQTVTGKEERQKGELCARAAALKLTERDLDDWLDDEGTQIARFWQPQTQQPQQPQQQQGQDSVSEDEDENSEGDDDGGRDAEGEEIDETDLAMSEIADANPFAVFPYHHENEGGEQDNTADHLLFELNNFFYGNQAAGASSSSLPAYPHPNPGHLTDEQIQLIREAELAWNTRMLEMMAAGMEVSFETSIWEDSWVRLGELRTEAVKTNPEEFYELTLGWGWSQSGVWNTDDGWMHEFGD